MSMKNATKAQKAEYSRVKSEGADKATLKALQNTFLQERRAENTQLAQLKDAQAAELYSLEKNLKALGITNKEIKAALGAEGKANKLEYSDKANTLRNEVGTGFIGYKGDNGEIGPVLSSASTYANNPDLLKSVGLDFNSALKSFSDLGVPMYAKQGDLESGLSLKAMMNQLDYRDPNTGLFNEKRNIKEGETKQSTAAFLNRQQQYTNKNLTPAEITGKPEGKLKQDKSNPDLFYYKVPHQEDSRFHYFKKNEDGTFANVGSQYVNLPEPEDDGGLFGQGGFLGLGDVLGPMAQIAGSIYGGPWVAAGLNSLNTATYGGDIGDILKSGAISYAGAKFIPQIVSKGLGSDVAMSTFGTNLAKIPGVVPGVSQAVTGGLSGQDLESALKSGVVGGLAANVASNVGQATGSKTYGNVAGNVTGGALSGGSLEDIAKGTAINLAGDYASGVARDYYNTNIQPSVSTGVKTAAAAAGAGPEVQSYIDDPKHIAFLKETGKALLKQKLSGGTPTMSKFQGSFAPGAVLQKVSSASAQPTTVQPITTAATNQAIVVKNGGRIRVDVSKLIPLNSGALAKYSR